MSTLCSSRERASIVAASANVGAASGACSRRLLAWARTRSTRSNAPSPCCSRITSPNRLPKRRISAPNWLKLSSIWDPPETSSDSSKDVGRLRHPAEDSSLCLDHLQAYLLKLWEIGPHAILRDKAVIASIIGFSDSGVDTDLGGHSSDDELLDGSVLENRLQVSGEEGAFPRLINYGLGR